MNKYPTQAELQFYDLYIRSSVCVDVWERTSGTSADVPRFGLRIHSVSSAICSYKNIGVKFDEIVNFFADLLVDFRLKCTKLTISYSRISEKLNFQASYY